MQARCNRPSRATWPARRLMVAIATLCLCTSPSHAQTTKETPTEPTKKAAQQKAENRPTTTQPTNRPAPDSPTAQAGQAAAGRQSGLRSEAEIRTNTEVQRLLDEIEAHLRKLEWLATDIRQEMTLRGFTFTARGRYIVGPNNLMRLEYKVKLSDVEGELLEVCDGRDQWHVESILDVTKVEHLNLEECGQILNDQDFDEQQRQAFMDARGLNGLAPFVDALAEFFVFNRVEEKQWQGKKVLVAHGTWNEARLGGKRAEPEAGDDQDQQQTSAIPQAEERERYSLLNLPPEMPTAITVWIDPELKWIHRVEMVAERAPKNRPSRLVLELSNPQFDKPFERTLFSYRPPDDVKPIDRTPVVVETLQVILQQLKNQKQQAGTRQPATASGATGSGLLGPTSPSASGPAGAQAKPSAEQKRSPAAKQEQEAPKP